MGKIKNSLFNTPDRTNTINDFLSEKYFNFRDPRTHNPPRHKYNLIGDRVEECKEVIVYTFSMGDVEDPDLYAAEPLYRWQESEAGQWIMKNAADTPTWYRIADPVSMGYKYQIRAKLMGPCLTEWLLKYGS